MSTDPTDLTDPTDPTGFDAPKAPLTRTDDGPVVILTWADGENRLNADSVAAWHRELDEIEHHDGPVALVVTGSGKFFSNGLDLDWMRDHAEESGPMLVGVHRLLGRLLTLNCYTVAAVNGHAFAGGAMIACGFDHRVMRTDRGYWCLPEVDLGLPLTPAMFAVVSARLPAATLHDSIVTGRRYTAPEALEAGIIEQTATEGDLMEVALEQAHRYAAKNRSVIANHKRQMYSWVTDLTEPA